MPLLHCVTPGKSLNLSEHQLSHLYNGDYQRTYLQVCENSTSSSLQSQTQGGEPNGLMEATVAAVTNIISQICL